VQKFFFQNECSFDRQAYFRARISINYTLSFMKKLFLSLLAGSVLMSSCEQNKMSEANLTNEKDSLSYTIGLNLGESFSQSDIKDINYEMLIKGMKDQMDTSGTPMIELKDAEAYIQSVMMKRQEAKSEVDKKAGVEFLAANKSKEGVQTTASGLQYKVISEGTGPKPKATDMVTVHYHGTLVDGTVFDSSVDRGEPATFGLNQVIPGWTEGLQLMNMGGKYQFYIPQELGYGARGQGKIKPYSTLIFDVELINIDSSATPGGAGK
jgi:FKBP-type peptidyl-prolyl cis-trans isomerase FklB